MKRGEEEQEKGKGGVCVWKGRGRTRGEKGGKGKGRGRQDREERGGSQCLYTRATQGTPEPLHRHSEHMHRWTQTEKADLNEWVNGRRWTTVSQTDRNRQIDRNKHRERDTPTNRQTFSFSYIFLFFLLFPLSSTGSFSHGLFISLYFSSHFLFH